MLCWRWAVAGPASAPRPGRPSTTSGPAGRPPGSPASRTACWRLRRRWPMRCEAISGYPSDGSYGSRQCSPVGFDALSARRSSGSSSATTWMGLGCRPGRGAARAVRPEADTCGGATRRRAAGGAERSGRRRRRRSPGGQRLRRAGGDGLRRSGRGRPRQRRRRGDRLGRHPGQSPGRVRLGGGTGLPGRQPRGAQSDGGPRAARRRSVQGSGRCSAAS